MLGIQKKLIGYNFSKRSSKAQFIVIHDVGATGSTAQNNRDYFAGGDRQASADFFIDSDNIIQIIDYTKNYSWAIGDGHGEFGKTNANSLSIEMCLQSNGQPTEKTIQNALDLTQYLMKELNISAANVVRHYDCSHKCCPGSFSANNWAEWTKFKTRLASTSTIATAPVVDTTTFRVRLSWANEKSQIGCFGQYQQAKDFANLHVGYSVYDVNGKDLYTLAVAKPVSSADATYRVVTGSFSDKDNADKRVADLKKAGVDSFITTK